MSARKKTPLIAARPDAAFRFDARLFSAVASFRAIFDIRYYLQGVNFLPHPEGGAMLVGTDGHQLAIAYDPEGRAAEPRIVPVSKGAAAAAARSVGGTVFIANDRLVVVDKGATEVFIQPGLARIEGKFPDVFRVLPADPAKLKPTAAGCFNGTYIERVGRVARMLSGEFDKAITHWQEPAEGDYPKTLVTRFACNANFVVLTMPMRGDIPSPALPPKIMAGKPSANAEPVKQRQAEAV